MMTLANYGIISNKYKDPVSAKSLSKSLKIRSRAESTLKQCLKSFHRLPGDKRQDILETIDDYYSRVPFNVVIWNKAETKHCVVDSILSLDYKFNPYKARNAFQIIETMLLNLESFPWHKEFTKIVTYSGRFRQDVSEPLIGVEHVLNAAGFQKESDEQPMHLILAPNRMPQVDGSEHVIQVIFDCMLAQVVMSDIISVLESTCKSAKLSPNQLAMSSEVNCYLWIQSYFRERSHQVTEKACTSIQELLNNITNHLTKQKLTSIKTPARTERPNDAQTSHNKMDETSQGKRKSSDSPNLFHRQKPFEDASLFHLSDDLLKLPAQISERDNESHNFNGRNSISAELLRHRDIPYHDGDIAAAGLIGSENPPSEHGRQHPPTRYVPKPREFDTIDGSCIRQNASRESDYDHSGHPTRVDLPHDDRELLIPKRERKFVPEHTNEISQPIRNNIEAQYGNRQANPSQEESASKIIDLRNHPARSYHYDDFSSIRNQSTSQSQQLSTKNSSSRFDYGAAHGKYEPRDVDRPSNGRMQWSCASCTFYNHPANETCEMCGIRKPF